MKVFISHSHASGGNEKLVSDLVDQLKSIGITTSTGVSSSETAEGPSSNAALLHQDLQTCDKVLLLIDSARPRTAWQDLEWRASLEAVWTDPRKKLIPVLIGHVEVPNFVRSSVRPGEAIEAIRVEDLKRDWSEVTTKLVKAFKDEASLESVAENFNSTTQDRAAQDERLSYVKSAAEKFKQ